MRPQGILRTSNNSTISNFKKSVSWGLVYSLSHENEHSVEEIPKTTVQEQEIIDRQELKDYFKDGDTSGLQKSRKRPFVFSGSDSDFENGQSSNLSETQSEEDDFVLPARRKRLGAGSQIIELTSSKSLEEQNTSLNLAKDPIQTPSSADDLGLNRRTRRRKHITGTLA